MESKTQTNLQTTDRRRRILSVSIGLLCLLLFPALSFFLFEYVSGNPFLIPFWYIKWNIIWICLLYWILFALSGSSRAAIPAASALLFLISAAEAFVMEFRGFPIRIWDILSLKTALSVAGNYTFRISRQMAVSGVTLILANLLAWFFPIRLGNLKKRLAGLLGVSVLSVGAASYFYLYLVPHYHYGINMWDANETYRNYGYIFSTAVSIQYMFSRAPEGYSESRLQEIEEELADSEAPSVQYGDIQPVNLICIMNESLSDLHVAGDFTTNEDYFPFIHSMNENTVKGSLYVPVFGATTANTEYEFLTGDSMHIFPSGIVPFQIYVRNNMTSLVSTLKAQGYTAIGMHPYPGNNWNREEVYRFLGFDRFLDLSFYDSSDLLRNYVSDRSDYERLIDMVNAKTDPSDRLFIFNVTMQNHGGYGEASSNFNETIRLTGDLAGKYRQTDQFLSLMKESDEAFEYLIDYFSRCSQPTMIVMFGDHQPSVENDFYDDIPADPEKERTDEERLIWYQTPFIIWTNYPLPSRSSVRLSSIFLSSLILDRANLSKTPYQQYLLDMMQTLPVVNPIGCMDSDGEFHTWDSLEQADSPYHRLIMDYEYMAYNHALDSGTYTPLFTLRQNDQTP